MVKIVDQNIPAEFFRQYERSLGISQLWKPGSDILTIRKRPPYRLPHMKTNSGNSPSGAQKKVRAAFKKCVDCFNASPRTGGVEPPTVGYRSKEWWYNAAGEATYPPYLGEDFHTWNNVAMDPEQLKDSNYTWHDANWFLKIDEADFITFYDEMKIKYGYPWSATNNPDQIVTKMNQIVCNEIEYDLKADASVCFTPGQTAQARKGICDDQSILHYALTWKALKELGWSDSQINERLGCIINEQSGQGHVYNWWKANNGATKIIENTYDPGDSPDVMGDMAYWGEDKAEYLTQRFDKSGHWKPYFMANGVIRPLWYYNYFISQTWATFFAGGVPDWCQKQTTNIPYHSIGQRYKRSASIRGASSNFDGFWSQLYNKFLGESWEAGGSGLSLFCKGSISKRDGYYRSPDIILQRVPVIYHPSSYVSEATWDAFTEIKVVIYRFLNNSKDGGSIRILEAGGSQKQIAGNMTFDVPKGICDYNSFTLTFEGMCESEDDLKPNRPEEGENLNCGYWGHVSVDLICS